jgi:hypothetical protein
LSSLPVQVEKHWTNFRPEIENDQTAMSTLMKRDSQPFGHIFIIFLPNLFEDISVLKLVGLLGLTY